jgi:hypothetical protein
VLLLIVGGFTSPVMGQSHDWCGYALIENLPVLENQLQVIAAITPRKNEVSSKPNELFQYRYSLDGRKVIIEGCFQIYPERDLVVSLLATSVPVDSKILLEQMPELIEIGNIDISQPIAESELKRAYISKELVYSIFAPGESREMSAAATRAYLAANVREWELEDMFETDGSVRQ